MSNKIKSVKIYRVDHLPGTEITDAEKYGIMHSMEEFDKDGNLTMEVSYTSDGDIGDKSEHRYDEKGRLLESRIYGDDGEVLERNEFMRDEDGRLQRELVHYLDGSVDTRSFYYNDNNMLTSLEAMDEDGETEFSEKYTYDNDQLIRIERFDADDETVFIQEDMYENGKLMQRKVWSAEEEEPYTLVTEYNGNGHRLKETRYDSKDRVTERNIYEEDEQGRVFRVVEENRQRKNTTEISFDERGNVVYQKELDMNGELNHEIFRYYDEEGKIVRTTVEAINKQNGVRRAYSMVYLYEIMED